MGKAKGWTMLRACDMIQRDSFISPFFHSPLSKMVTGQNPFMALVCACEMLLVIVMNNKTTTGKMNLSKSDMVLFLASRCGWG